ncbi:MAG: AAA family ATPase [Collinsella sp.]
MLGNRRFFTDAPTLRALLARGAAGADVAVLEGVMGFYDGMAPGVADASSYQVARDTETPVVLVVNGRGASLSLAAVIRGIAEFLPCANVRGVVLNKTSAAACAYAAPAIEKHTGVAVLGNIPADEAFSLESRHLGLETADEDKQLSARIDKMAELVEKSVDVDRLLEIAATAPDIREEPYRLEPIAGARPIVAVALDEAFSFYYDENLRALEDLGCELAFFSPLCDSELPRDKRPLSGRRLPGAPCATVSENAPMREAVRRAQESGMPTVAECGGFLYLQREIADSEGGAGLLRAP